MIISFSGPQQLVSSPGRVSVRAAPSPIIANSHMSRRQSTSEEDNNAFEDKKEVIQRFYKFFLQNFELIFKGHIWIIHFRNRHPLLLALENMTQRFK